MRYMMLLLVGLQAGWVHASLPITGAEVSSLPLPAAVVAEPTEGDVAAPQFVAPQADDLLEFINRDRMHGRLVSASAQMNQLTWQSSAAAADIAFQTESLARVALAPRIATKPGTYGAVAHLTNGDVLPGYIVAMDADTLVMDTWYAGEVRINRSMVMSILPNLSQSNILYEGPNSLEEWTLSPHMGNRPQWRYADGALYSIQQQPIGRMIEGLPDTYEVYFDVAWRSSHPNFSFTFNTPNVQQNTDAYVMSVQSTTIMMSRSVRNRGTRNFGTRITHSGFDGSSGQRSARFGVLVDKDSRNFTLLIDGDVVGQWTDAEAFAGQGEGIAFRSGSMGDIKISNIRVAPWDGRLPGAAGDGEDIGEYDQVRFVNNDKFSGQVLSVENDTLRFKTVYATLDIPMDRVMEIVMADEKSERARRRANDVMAVFADRGLLTVEIDRIEDGILHGASENFGNISLPLGVLRTLQWNIYREPAEDDPDTF